MSIIEGKTSQLNTISRYNKYLNNSQSNIPSQHDLSGTFQSYQPDHHSSRNDHPEPNEVHFNAYGDIQGARSVEQQANTENSKSLQQTPEKKIDNDKLQLFL